MLFLISSTIYNWIEKSDSLKIVLSFRTIWIHDLWRCFQTQCSCSIHLITSLRVSWWRTSVLPLPEFVLLNTHPDCSLMDFCNSFINDKASVVALRLGIVNACCSEGTMYQCIQRLQGLPWNRWKEILHIVRKIIADGSLNERREIFTPPKTGKNHRRGRKGYGTRGIFFFTRFKIWRITREKEIYLSLVSNHRLHRWLFDETRERKIASHS